MTARKLDFALVAASAVMTARSCARHERATAKEASSTTRVSAADISSNELAVLYQLTSTLFSDWLAMTIRGYEGTSRAERSVMSWDAFGSRMMPPAAIARSTAGLVRGVASWTG